MSNHFYLTDPKSEEVPNVKSVESQNVFYTFNNSLSSFLKTNFLKTNLDNAL